MKTITMSFSVLSIISGFVGNANSTRFTFRKGMNPIYRKMSTRLQPKVFVTRRVPQDGINLLRQKCEVTQWDRDEAIPRHELLNGVKGVDGLFCLLTDKIDDEVLSTAG